MTWNDLSFICALRWWRGWFSSSRLLMRSFDIVRVVTLPNITIRYIYERLKLNFMIWFRLYIIYDLSSSVSLELPFLLALSTVVSDSSILQLGCLGDHYKIRLYVCLYSVTLDPDLFSRNTGAVTIYDIPPKNSMMTSSNGNIFRVTGDLCGEFTGPGEFPTQMPVTRSFDVYFDLRPNKWLSKQSWGWWFGTLSCSLWRHRNGIHLNLAKPCSSKTSKLTISRITSKWRYCS